MGRTRILKLTNKFYDYFDVVENQLRSKMQSVMQSENKIEEAKSENNIAESEVGSKPEDGAIQTQDKN